MIGLLCFVVTSTGGVATQGEAPRLSHEQRSLVPRPDVSMVSVDPGGRYDRPARNAGTLASGRLSSLLALEIELAGRAPANRNRIAGTDQADQHGEPALGCATHSRRTAPAWVECRSINRRHVHGQATRTSKSGMADLSAKPRSRHRRHGFVRGPDHWLQTALWLRDCTD